MPSSIRPGDVLGERYLLEDLLTESGNGRFWRAHDRVLERHVAVHVVAAADEHADAMMDAARSSATVADRRILRVLDVDRRDQLCWVVNEWGSGISLDRLIATEGPVSARRAAWMVAEVADTIATAHEKGVAHGRLVPENVLVDRTGQIRVIGFSVEAALLGLPPGRISSDVVDLAGLLYFLLTGRWPGVSRSAMPDAPQEAGRVLRPRQVKAGVPRVLDELCDQVLNPYAENADPELRAAAGIRDRLRDFVGDDAGMAAAEAGRHDTGETRALVLPPLPDPPVRGDDAEPDATDAGTPEAAGDPPTVAVPPAAPAQPDLPTQAGVPIFDDDADDVSWLDARRDPPPPPPPFEEPPERPLFAPEPPGGGPARRPRSTARAQPAAGDYWPWDTGTGTGTGTGLAAVDDPDDDGEDRVPGRSWLWLAGAVGAATLLLVAIVFAFNLGRGRTPLGGEPDPDPSASPSASARPEPVSGVTARDLDPQGDPPEENPDTAPQAVDGDPDTTWRTSTYNDQLGPPPGLKTGVGLLLDLGSPQEVAGVDLTLVGEPTAVSIYVTDREPTGVAGLSPVTRLEAGSREQVDLDSPTTGQYVIVWFTRLPAVPDGFRAEVAEIVVRA